MKNNYRDNVNLVVRSRYDSSYIIKHYETKERYNCEKYYIDLFAKKGFRVPKIISYNSNKLTIIMNRIPGTSSYSMDNDTIHTCIQQLVNIQKKIPTLKTADASYINSVRISILNFCNLFSKKVNLCELDNKCNQLRDNFHTALFKDAKPTNWINSQEALWMIDFDYVKESFFMADLAQLLNYQLHLDDVSTTKFVQCFINNLNIRTLHKQSIFMSLFNLTSINSMLKAIQHNNNLPNKYVNEFHKKCFMLLEKDNII